MNNLGDVLWAMIYFYFVFMVIWIFIRVFADIFRRAGPVRGLEGHLDPGHLHRPVLRGVGLHPDPPEEPAAGSAGHRSRQQVAAGYSVVRRGRQAGGPAGLRRDHPGRVRRPEGEAPRPDPAWARDGALAPSDYGPRVPGDGSPRPMSGGILDASAPGRTEDVSMLELPVKEGRLPELRLPEISRDEIMRTFSEIKRPDLSASSGRDLSDVEWPKVDLPAHRMDTRGSRQGDRRRDHGGPARPPRGPLASPAARPRVPRRRQPRDVRPPEPTVRPRAAGPRGRGSPSSRRGRPTWSGAPRGRGGCRAWIGAGRGGRHPDRTRCLQRCGREAGQGRKAAKTAVKETVEATAGGDA